MIFSTDFEEHKLKLLEIHNNIMLEVHGQIVKKLFNRCNM